MKILLIDDNRDDRAIANITERKQAETLAEIEKQRSKFLAEASRLLNSSLESSTTLKNLANLAVPKLADICLINTVEPTTLLFGEPIVAASGSNYSNRYRTRY
jgi:hypothetical protein